MSISEHDIERSIADVRSAVKERHILNALNKLDSLLSADTLFAPLRREAANLRETHTFMTNYALAGLADPTRGEMISRLGREISSLASRARRLSRSIDNPTLYYSTLRYEAMQPDSSLPTLADRLLDKSSQLSKMLFVDPQEKADRTIRCRTELESIMRRWFRLLWVTYPLSEKDREAIGKILNSDTVTSTVKATTLGALMLGSLEEFDPARVTLVMDKVLDEDKEIAVRATVYLAIMLAMTTDRSVLTDFKARFDALAEQQRWRDNLRAVFTQLLRSRDTERVTRKLTDEILPTMKDMGKELTDRVKGDKINLEDIEQIDELQAMMENSELAAKMREMSEMQQQGADVLMTTFANLKNFPFFNEISNWFLPFDPRQSDVAKVIMEFGPMAELIASNPDMCDNDRYSVTLAMAGMPQMQRDFIAKQLEANADQLAQMQASALDASSTGRDQLTANYVRSLYRFFKLFNRHNEFRDPFETPLNLLSVEQLSASLDRRELIREAADFFFTHGYMADALPLLTDLERSMPGGEEATIYYRIGCAMLAMGHNAEALSYFEKSELFNEDDSQLLLKMAMTLRNLGNHRRAADYYRRVSRQRGGDDHIDLFTAASLTAIGAWNDAAALFYRIDYNRGLPRQSVRQLALCEYKLREYDKSVRTLSRITSLKAPDYALLAASAMASGDYASAADRLSKSDAEGVEKFLDLVADINCDRDLTDIIVDQALASFSK